MTTLSELERAVYALADAGAIDARTAPLYQRALGRLAALKLITRHEDGTYRAVRAATDRRPTLPPALPREEPKSEPPPAAEPVEPQGVLVVRVPQAWLDALDARGESRSAATREILGRALASGSGSRRRVAS